MKRRRLWKLTTGRRHMAEDELAECLQLYIDGALLKTLEARYGRHRVVIGRHVKAAGVQRGHKFRCKFRNLPLDRLRSKDGHPAQPRGAAGGGVAADDLR